MSFNSTFADLRDRVLLWMHGRRLGLIGDGQSSSTNGLTVDGTLVGSSRTGCTPYPVSAAGVAAAGPVTVANALVGDNVFWVMGPTNADASASFATTVTVAGQVQQTSGSNLSGNQYVFYIQPQA